jgi:sugar phosphate isomerase/epimerase
MTSSRDRYETGWPASLSTMWAYQQHPNLEIFLAHARQAGFNRFELNHQVDTRWLLGDNLKTLTLPSIHEPCPADISTGELKRRDWLVSSLDEDNRRQGVGAILRTIDMARDLGIPLMVLHPGSVSLDLRLEMELRRLYDQGHQDSPQAAELSQRLAVERQAQAPARLEAVKRSLGELVEAAARAGVRIGLENRYHFFDITLPDEMSWLLDGFDPDRVGVWYDSGHAFVMDRLGFIPNKAWFTLFRDRIIGAHLHDVQGLDDHNVPGTGELDWEFVRGLVPPQAAITLEIKPGVSPEQIIHGMRHLTEVGILPSPS